jgi:hypothetical protein
MSEASDMGNEVTRPRKAFLQRFMEERMSVAVVASSGPSAREKRRTFGKVCARGTAGHQSHVAGTKSGNEGVRDDGWATGGIVGDDGIVGDGAREGGRCTRNRKRRTCDAGRCTTARYCYRWTYGSCAEYGGHSKP